MMETPISNNRRDCEEFAECGYFSDGSYVLRRENHDGYRVKPVSFFFDFAVCLDVESFPENVGRDCCTHQCANSCHAVECQVPVYCADIFFEPLKDFHVSSCCGGCDGCGDSHATTAFSGES